MSDDTSTPSDTNDAGANSPLAQLADAVASTVVMASTDDLPLLTQIHDELQKLADQASKDGAKAVGESAASTRALVEKIILSEVDDTAKALSIVSERVVEIQNLVRCATEGPFAEFDEKAQATAVAAPASEPAASPAKPAPAPAPVDAAPAADAPHGQPEAVTLNAADLPLISEFMGEASAHLEAAEANLLKLEENPTDSEAINAIFRAFHTIKGVAGFLNLTPITSLAHISENLLDLARHGKLAVTPAIVDVVLAASDAMKGLIKALDLAAKNGTPFAGDASLPPLLDRIAAAARGEATASAPAAKPASSESGTPASAAAPQHAQSTQSGGGSSTDSTVKVSTERLDGLINMVGELVIAQAMVRQDLTGVLSGNHRLARNASQLAKITRELQGLSMSMRMVPIQGVFQKMSRLVRDLSRKFMKDVDLVLVGGETELDRNVVEAISDPLVHMVRNAIDHGIDTPEQREKAGKPRTGRVELKAYHEAGNIVIEITDDGKGLNKKRLIEKALAAGIIKEGQQLSDQETFRLIFHAGLSTAEKVTDVSGRGVGMDVVKRNVEALRGRIDIISAEGKGSTFTIRLPLTLAVIDGLVVKVGGERYILPITSIEQSIQPKADQLSTVQNRGEMCMVRGALLPLFRLHRLFKVTPRTEDPTEALVVIVQDNDRRCCLLVDELLGQQQVVIKSLSASLGSVPGISGGAILGDGNVSLILDVPGILDLAGKN